MLATSFLRPEEKKAKPNKLSLVALMDIFTILVFFLLLNSGESQQIENAKFVQLPDSSKGTLPHDELLIIVDRTEIWMQDTKIADLNNAAIDPDKPIPELQQALDEYSQRIPELSGFEKKNGLAVTIMGDKTVSYALLKSVMTTCRTLNFRNIALAVNSVSGTAGRPLPKKNAEAVLAMNMTQSQKKNGEAK